MADDKLFPYQARVPVTADGALPSVDLVQFLNKVQKIVGGVDASTNYQLAQNLQALTDAVGVGAFDKPKPPRVNLTEGDYIALTKDAGGYTVALSLGDVIGAIAPFITQPKPRQQRPDDAQFILAQQLFSPR